MKLIDEGGAKKLLEVVKGRVDECSATALGTAKIIDVNEIVNGGEPIEIDGNNEYEWDYYNLFMAMKEVDKRYPKLMFDAVAFARVVQEGVESVLVFYGWDPNSWQEMSDVSFMGTPENFSLKTNWRPAIYSSEAPLPTQLSGIFDILLPLQEYVEGEETGRYSKIVSLDYVLDDKLPSKQQAYGEDMGHQQPHGLSNTTKSFTNAKFGCDINGQLYIVEPGSTFNWYSHWRPWQVEGIDLSPYTVSKSQLDDGRSDYYVKPGVIYKCHERLYIGVDNGKGDGCGVLRLLAFSDEFKNKTDRLEERIYELEKDYDRPGFSGVCKLAEVDLDGTLEYEDGLYGDDGQKSLPSLGATTNSIYFVDELEHKRYKGVADVFGDKLHYMSRYVHFIGNRIFLREGMLYSCGDKLYYAESTPDMPLAGTLKQINDNQALTDAEIGAIVDEVWV